MYYARDTFYTVENRKQINENNLKNYLVRLTLRIKLLLVQKAFK